MGVATGFTSERPGAGGGEEIAEDGVDVGELALDVLERGGRARPRRVARDLERDPRPAERRTELVADRREQLALIAHDARDPVGHLVERLRHPPHLVARPSGVRPPRRVRAVRSPPPKRSAASATSSSGHGEPPRHPARREREDEQRRPERDERVPVRRRRLIPASNSTAPEELAVADDRNEPFAVRAERDGSLPQRHPVREVIDVAAQVHVEPDEIVHARDVALARFRVVPVAREVVRDRARGHARRRRGLRRSASPTRRNIAAPNAATIAVRNQKKSRACRRRTRAGCGRSEPVASAPVRAGSRRGGGGGRRCSHAGLTST